MTAVLAEGIEGYRALIGQPLGPTDWATVTQDQVDLFAEATGDHQWIHVDPERAAEGPFGGTIAHGFLTLSLVPTFLPKLIEARGFTMGVNYGCDRVRFPSPVPVGSRVRCSGVIDEVADVPGGIQVNTTLTIECDRNTKPACVATVLARRYI